MDNQTTKITSEYNAYTPDAKIIKEFFTWFDGAADINNILWDMLYGSITNPEYPSDHKQNDSRSFLYKRLTELMVAIEPPERICKSDLREN